MIEDQLAALVAAQQTTHQLLGELCVSQAQTNRLLAGQQPEPPQPEPSEPATPADEIVPLDDVRPVDVLPILADWTLTLPIDKPGATDSPWNDYPDKLVAGRAPGMFYAARVGNRRGVVFEVRDPNNGAHTKNSDYPRSEVREMATGKRWVKAGYPSTRLTVVEAELAIITSGLVTRPRIAGFQFHNGADDVCQVIASEDGQLGVSWRDGDEWTVLREHYAGERFRLRVATTGGGQITFDVDGERRGQIEAKGSGWYVKAGAYLQTGGESAHREPATAVGRVVYFALDVQPRS